MFNEQMELGQPWPLHGVDASDAGVDFAPATLIATEMNRRRSIADRLFTIVPKAPQEVKPQNDRVGEV